jgi:hypothetical protein
VSVFSCQISFEFYSEQIDTQAPAPAPAAVTSDQNKKKEAKTKEQIRQDQARASHEELMHPSRKLLHKLFALIAFLTAVAALCLAVGEILAIIFESHGPIEYTLNAYLLLCCMFIMFNELQWTMLTQEASFLGHWVTRGLFYVFIGVISIEQNDKTFQAGQTKRNNHLAYNVSMAYIKAVAYVIMGFGVLYFLMGLFCLHRVYNGLLKDYTERVEMAKRLRKHGGASVATSTDVETG